ncbi:glycosyltransferase involved in cell wall biosynthesis [Pseudomonas sp. SJZ085]|nr:glycosyltransferase involved in cell wall biosynthesis [Pseudomonas sp. SJZ074]TWC39272.1 glycosyltransferase involved in cell wall biosynthesis [Pseudomonas sp. SJZ085]
MVSHVSPDSIYGAGSSLRQHMELMGKYHLSLFSPVHRSVTSVGKGVDVINFFSPITYNYDVQLSFFRRFILSWASRFAFWASSPWVLYKLFRLSPNIIHLNSLVLSDFLLLLRAYRIFKKVAVVSHVREMLDTQVSTYQKYLMGTCDHFIFIDKAVQQRFYEVVGAGHEFDIVQNPFKGARANERLPKEIATLKEAGKIVFAIAGRIESGKGVLEVCSHFLSQTPTNATLLIVGGGATGYIDQLRTIVDRSNGTIVYLGQVTDLQSTGFFGEIDFLIRGEPFFCTGRTVYESLYSGSNVIVPALNSDLEKDELLVEFKEKVFCYPPGDFASLMVLVETLSGCRKSETNRSICDNYENYVASLNSIYSKVVK